MSDIARPYCVSILGSVCVTFGRKKETGYFIEAQNVPNTLTWNEYTKKEEKNVVWLCQCDQRYDDGGNGDYDDYEY